MHKGDYPHGPRDLAFSRNYLSFALYLRQQLVIYPVLHSG